MNYAEMIRKHLSGIINEQVREGSQEAAAVCPFRGEIWHTWGIIPRGEGKVREGEANGKMQMHDMWRKYQFKMIFHLRLVTVRFIVRILIIRNYILCVYGIDGIKKILCLSNASFKLRQFVKLVYKYTYNKC